MTRPEWRRRLLASTAIGLLLSMYGDGGSRFLWNPLAYEL